VAAALPTQPGERIAIIDIVRAFALLGILVMNMPAFSEPVFRTGRLEEIWPAWWDRAALWIADAFFAGKFNSLFSFLFGVGFAIQMRRLSERGARATLVYLRRLLWLFVFGVGHALLVWDGDILHMYAVLGFLLLLVRKAPDRVIAAMILAALLLPLGAGLYWGLTSTPESLAAEKAAIAQLESRERAVYPRGGYWEATALRVDSFRFLFRNPLYLIISYPQIVLTLLMGYYVGRKNWIVEAEGKPEAVRRVQLWTLALGLASGVGYGITVRFTQPFEPSLMLLASMILYNLARPLLMLFYGATFLRLYRTQRGKAMLDPFRFAGRMPLTNYLMQSVVCTGIFYWYGLGLYGKVGPAVLLVSAFAIFSVEVAWSIWWFRGFRFGPAEWAWRVLTYLKAPAARKVAWGTSL
jgi:uncharacterized protein